MMARFNFIEAYKELQPMADRGIVEWRNASFAKLVKTIEWKQILDLSRLAFNLPYDAKVYEGWFQKALHQTDAHFFVAQDAAEAGRVATLILRHFVSLGNETACTTALIALAASFAGKRSAFDNGELVSQSRDVLTAAATKGAMTAPSGKVALRQAGDLSTLKTEMTNGFDAVRTASFIEGAVQDLRDDAETAVSSLSNAYLALRRDNLRLAEEADMLWWHVGDWSNVLDVPRSGISKKSVGLVSGLDLGAMVRFSPGPYGAYGILRQSLGKDHDKPTLLKDAVAGLDGAQLARLTFDNAPDVFPVLTALRLAAAGGDWAERMAKLLPFAVGEKLTHLELATQAYRERVSLTNVGMAG